MRFAILVNEGPYTHQASDTAYHFAKAALAGGHEIFRVFFYHDGVHNATRLAAPPQDERRVPEAWTPLVDEPGVGLVVCAAAAPGRGVVEAGEHKPHGMDANNIPGGFSIPRLRTLN